MGDVDIGRGRTSTVGPRSSPQVIQVQIGSFFGLQLFLFFCLALFLLDQKPPVIFVNFLKRQISQIKHIVLLLQAKSSEKYLLF